MEIKYPQGKSDTKLPQNKVSQFIFINSGTVAFAEIYFRQIESRKLEVVRFRAAQFKWC